MHHHLTPDVIVAVLALIVSIAALITVNRRP